MSKCKFYKITYSSIFRLEILNLGFRNSTYDNRNKQKEFLPLRILLLPDINNFLNVYFSPPLGIILSKIVLFTVVKIKSQGILGILRN